MKFFRGDHRCLLPTIDFVEGDGADVYFGATYQDGVFVKQQG